jgi:hypothetical protein
MRVVIFSQRFDVYNGGEVAGFDDSRAGELVNSGVARYHRQPATLKELEAEVLAAGYTAKVAKKIAAERFDGMYGEGARCLGGVTRIEQEQHDESEEAGADKSESASADGGSEADG